MADGDAPMTGFLTGPGKAILKRATLGMGILGIAYVIFWPILPGGLLLYRAFPWVALAALGLAATGWFVQQRIQRRRQADSVTGGGVSGTRRRLSPPSLPPSMRRLKEALTCTVLCMGVIFIVSAIIAPFMPDPVDGPNWWLPLVLLGLCATDPLRATWSEKCVNRD